MLCDTFVKGWCYYTAVIAAALVVLPVHGCPSELENKTKIGVNVSQGRCNHVFSSKGQSHG